jgi:cytochrome c
MLCRTFAFSFLVFLVSLPLTGLAQPAELMIAARGGDLDTVNVLLASGTEPDPEGIATPLYFAAQGGHVEIVQALLNHGADPNAMSDWGTPLHIAARRGHTEIVKAILENGGDPKLLGDKDMLTPLHMAAQNGSVDVGQLLISFGADVNARTRWYQPPMHFAVQRNRTDFEDFLLRSGASADPVEAISGELAEADLEKGRIKSVECGNCHLLGAEATHTGEVRNIPGPPLWGIVGRAIANQDFPYLDRMRSMSGEWTCEELNAFLADPAGTVPGTNMLQGFVTDKADRIALIAYLRTQSDDPVPLP